MVTGVECAGLIIGIFPLIVEGLKAYSDGLKRIKRARQYASILGKYNTDLSIEAAQFQNTFTRIILLAHSPELHRLFTKMNYKNFTRLERVDAGPELRKLLWLSLPNCSNNARVMVEEVINKLYQDLEQVREAFLIEQDSVSTPDEILLKKIVRRLKIELNSETRDEQLLHIRRRNQDLQAFVDAESMMQVVNTTRAQSGNKMRTTVETARAKISNVIRNQANLLHNVLEEKLGFCELPHAASLELETRPTQALLDCYNSTETLNKLRFKVVRQAELDMHPFWDLDLQTIVKIPQVQRIEQRGHCDNLSLEHCQVTKHWSCGDIQTAGGGYDQQSQEKLCSETLAPSSPPSTMGTLILHKTKKMFRNMIPTRFPSKFRRSVTAATRQPSSSSLTVGAIYVPAEQISLPTIVINQTDNIASSSNDRSTVSTERICVTCTFSNNEVLACLCSAVHTASVEQQHQRCIGVLSNTSNDKVRVCPRSGQDLKLQSKILVSLRTLLTGKVQIKIKELSGRSKLKLAVLLASSVMQLHETNWLNDLWSSHDIYFQQDASGEVDLHRGFVQRVFHARTDECVFSNADKDDWMNLEIGCNKMLFSLGIVLLEIFYWKPFPAIQDQKPAAEMIVSLFPKIFNNIGFPYGLAVKFCLHGLNTVESDLTRESFKTAVHENIVIPLEEQLKIFCGVSNLEEVFNEN
ncbi:hypothetical protein BDZ91DRAFT_748922 [Kalaharituber pfeilii]|nr:hypothetical protein BDZ91DRAFT_748922 [Kalaharituber pfeilii]